MSASDQINVRVPEHGRRYIHRIAQMLREDISFAHRLGRFLDEEAAQTQRSLTERLARLEAMLPMAADTFANRDAALFGGILNQNLERIVQPPLLVEGRGRSKRLTADGRDAVERHLRAGLTNRVIADRVGITPYAVSVIRARLGLVSA